MSWPCWLTDSRRLNHKVVSRPASSLAQERVSSLAETSVLTTMLRLGQAVPQQQFSDDIDPTLLFGFEKELHR